MAHLLSLSISDTVPPLTPATGPVTTGITAQVVLPDSTDGAAGTVHSTKFRSIQKRLTTAGTTTIDLDAGSLTDPFDRTVTLATLHSVAIWVRPADKAVVPVANVTLTCEFLGLSAVVISPAGTAAGYEEHVFARESRIGLAVGAANDAITVVLGASASNWIVDVIITGQVA